MTISKIFINGDSFLTKRPKDNVDTYSGLELSNSLGLPIVDNLAGGGRGNKRVSVTTKMWCEKYPEKASNTFFVIGFSSGTRFDYPTNDGYKKQKFPSLETTWKTFKPQSGETEQIFFKELFSRGMDLNQLIQIESLENIISLQNYLQVKKYPYIFFKTISDPEITTADVRFLTNAVNQKRFFHFGKSHLDYIIEKDLIANKEDPHPSTQGHEEWANMLKEFIDANNLLTI